MNKTEFTESIAGKADLSKAEAGRVVDAFIGIITKELSKNRSVTLTGFGTFEVRKRKARTGRNPKTGEAIQIKSFQDPCFQARQGF